MNIRYWIIVLVLIGLVTLFLWMMIFGLRDAPLA